jgi:hypothetical protein
MKILNPSVLNCNESIRIKAIIETFSTAPINIEIAGKSLSWFKVFDVFYGNTSAKNENKRS